MEVEKQYVMICDIDNCYTDSREWYKVLPKDIGNNRELWDEFQSKVNLVKPNKPVINLCVATVEILPVVFLTGREDRHDHREDTIKQIEEFSEGKIKINNDNRLIMRKEFDYRPSEIIKNEMLVGVVKEGLIPICAIDDEVQNCELYKRYNIPTVLYKIDTNEFVKFHKPTVKTQWED